MGSTIAPGLAMMVHAASATFAFQLDAIVVELRRTCFAVIVASRKKAIEIIGWKLVKLCRKIGWASSIAGIFATVLSTAVSTTVRRIAILKTPKQLTALDLRTSSLTAPVARLHSISFPSTLVRTASILSRAATSRATRSCHAVTHARKCVILEIARLVF